MPFAMDVSKMQSFLGDVHDCDVWITQFRDLLKTRRWKSPALEPTYAAAVWLLSEFTRKRTKAYRSALRLWTEMDRTEMPRRLRGVLKQI